MSDLRVLLRLPTWLGDCVMCTPALDNLRRQLPGAKLVAVSFAERRPAVPRRSTALRDRARTRPSRKATAGWTVPRLGRQLREEHGPFDLAFTFKNSFAARWLLLGRRCAAPDWRQDRLERPAADRRDSLRQRPTLRPVVQSDRERLLWLAARGRPTDAARASPRLLRQADGWAGARLGLWQRPPLGRRAFRPGRRRAQPRL